MRFLQWIGFVVLLMLSFSFRVEALVPSTALVQSDSLGATLADSSVAFSSGYESFLMTAMDADLLIKVVSQSDITEPTHWFRLDQDAVLSLTGAKIKKIWWRTTTAASGALQWVGIR